MQLFRSIVMTPVLLAGLAVSQGFAQQTTPQAGSPLRGYLIGGGGTSIGTAQSALVVSLEAAENVLPDVQVYMSAAYYDDLLSQVARDQLVTVGTNLTATTGTPWEFRGRDRGRSFTVGIKFLVPTATPVRPYIGGGVGAINLRRTIMERTRGNITEAFLRQFGSGDGVVDITQSNTTKPMTEVAAGVGATIGRAYVDVGYRYRKAFHNVNQAFDVSQLGVGLGVKF